MNPLARWFFLVLVLTSFGLAFFACNGDDDDDSGGGAGGDDDDNDNDDDESPADDDDDDNDESPADDDDDDNDESPDDDDDDNDESPDDDDDNDDNDDNDDDDNDDNDDTDLFIAVDHGSFDMGSPPGETGRRVDEAQHTVTLTRDFEIGATETRQGFFAEIMGFNPSWYPAFGDNPSLPVDRVTWFDALAFANKLSQARDYAACYALSAIVCADDTAGDETDYCKDHGGIKTATVAVNAATVYDCEGYRLPTEAEWEYAARAGTTTAFYNGEITQPQCWPVDPRVDEIAWFCANSGDKTHPVRVKTPNAWGLFDTSGNVAEWTWDWYNHDYPGDVSDPTGPDDGRYKAVRGGAARFAGGARLRSAARAGFTPDYRTQYMGFRVGRTLSASVAAGTPAAPAAPVAAAAPKDYPGELPFAYTRPDVGTPLTSDEITAFTQKLTGFWKDSNYLHWLLWVSHGMGEGHGMPDYKLFYGDLSMNKAGGVVTFTHGGGDDNLTIPTSKLFNNVMAAYLLTGDAAYGRLVEQYSKGYVALVDGMLWGDEDPESTIIARAVFPPNNTWEDEGRPGAVDYDPVRHQSFDWNAQTIENPVNPYYGDMWVRNRRSKDDVPHIYRVVPMLMRVAQDGVDESTREAAGKALTYLQNFARDVVDSGYTIRTKELGGNQQVPVDDNNMVLDLASFVFYERLLPSAECTGKLSSALIGYQSPLDVDCGNGIGWLYELIATLGHYYNYEIVRYFHVASLYNALMVGANDTAFALMEGMTERVDYFMYEDPNQADNAGWFADGAPFLLAAATTGFPLTSEEARLVVDLYSMSADHYAAWAYWDPWDPSVPDGAVPLTPSRDTVDGPAVPWDGMPFILEYCYSPLVNPASAPFVDCEVVRDPAQWGE